MQEKYPISCPYCSKELIIAPSIFHRMGLHDMGGAKCPDCHSEMQICYEEETDSMETKRMTLDV